LKRHCLQPKLIRHLLRHLRLNLWQRLLPLRRLDQGGQQGCLLLFVIHLALLLYFQMDWETRLGCLV
jgi:hypothetical protein